ncbi:MAG: glycosyl hydrolase, repeat-containing protein [Candidatus Solibacter sp.]|nr:glycosyl hydrolase, repeat-containing protein [Candidatus Solibacter sp.]
MQVGPEGRPAGARLSLLAGPGTYNVKLSAGGKELTERLLVLKDPHSGGSEADIRLQFTFLQSVQNNFVQVGQMVTQIETLRKQLQALGGSQQGSDLKGGAAALEEQLIEIEGGLHQLRITGGQDGMRWAGKLTVKIPHLFTELQNSDFAPTSQQITVNEQFTRETRELRTKLDQLMSKDVAAFNRLLAQRGVPAISTSAGNF